MRKQALLKSLSHTQLNSPTSPFKQAIDEIRDLGYLSVFESEPTPKWSDYGNSSFTLVFEGPTNGMYKHQIRIMFVQLSPDVMSDDRVEVVESRGLLGVKDLKDLPELKRLFEKDNSGLLAEEAGFEIHTDDRFANALVRIAEGLDSVSQPTPVNWESVLVEAKSRLADVLRYLDHFEGDVFDLTDDPRNLNDAQVRDGFKSFVLEVWALYDYLEKIEKGLVG